MKTVLLTALLLLTQVLTAQEAASRPSALSSKAIEAYGVKSEARVNEFFDYLELLSDPKLNTDMKAHTIAETLKLFNDETIVMDNIFIKTNDAISLKELLKQVASQKKKCSFKVTGFSWIPQKEVQNFQQWLVTYELLQDNRAPLHVTQEFFIVYEDKQFGKTVMKVWNTYLGKITVTR
jgi:spore coat protein CotF